MRWPTQNELYYVSWGAAGLALLLAVVVVIAHGSTRLLSVALAVSGAAAFSGAYTFVVNRRLSEFGSRLALGCFIVGWVFVALLPLVPLDRGVYSVVGYSLLGIGMMGFFYIVFVEIPVTMPKKPESSRRGRLLDAGLLLIILGSWIAFLRGFPLPVPREFYESFFSPLGLTGNVSWIAGIVLFSLAVLRARKQHISEGNEERLRPHNELTDPAGQPKT